MATAVTAEVRLAGPTTAEEMLAWPDLPPGEIVDGVWVPRYQRGEVTGTRVEHGLVALRGARVSRLGTRRGRGAHRATTRCVAAKPAAETR